MQSRHATLAVLNGGMVGFLRAQGLERLTCFGRAKHEHSVDVHCLDKSLYTVYLCCGKFLSRWLEGPAHMASGCFRGTFGAQEHLDVRPPHLARHHRSSSLVCETERMASGTSEQRKVEPADVTAKLARLTPGDSSGLSHCRPWAGTNCFSRVRWY